MSVTEIRFQSVCTCEIAKLIQDWQQHGICEEDSCRLGTRRPIDPECILYFLITIEFHLLKVEYSVAPCCEIEIRI